MDRKDKETKKTIADELLEDNFFKPPIDDVIEEAPPEKQGGTGIEGKAAEENESSLLFDEFLKSPVETAPEETSELTVEPARILTQKPTAKIQVHVSSSKPASVVKAAGQPGSNTKIIIASLGGAAILLVIAGYIYLGHRTSSPAKNNAVTGSQTIVMTPETPQPVQQKPSASEQPVNQPAQQVAENAPPVQKPQPEQVVQEASKQFAVTIEKIKTKTALNSVRRIGETMDKSLNFDIKENTAKSNTQYSLFVDKIYPSDGEATADNLKLMVANVSNASVIKSDGGYRLLVGKYGSMASAEAEKKNIEAAGLKSIIKEATNKASTYNVKVFPFRSSQNAQAYISKVKRFGAKADFAEIK